ncbi:winged helix-turn-helix domain-containing tetratricopeptide repeat protein [Demequina sp. SO4-13]|uniref:winged helix-turn-helix domain-containing tetratricopeptide repeat protein n=1 Tax=Demequina sp. SO4-13 TaxID=3401027 RepID=UPI003AF5B087
MALRFGECVLDRGLMELRRAGRAVPIEPRAMQVLLHLVDARDRVVPKEELLDAVWGSRFVTESALSSQIRAIRRATGDSGDAQRVIRTVHGRGYRFVAAVREQQSEDTPRARPAETVVDTDRDRPVIAVLPFADVSSTAEHAHVARGFTQDVIATLSKHRWLRVLTGAATAGMSGAPDAMARMRDELGARYAVEGSVRLDGDRLRVSASLTDTTARICLWADTFDRTFGDLFSVLDEVTDIVVATVEPQVGLAERHRSSSRPRTDLRTWDLFHQGTYQFFQFTREGNREAQTLLNRCRDIEPEFADAHAWWAYSVVLGMVYWDTDPTVDLLDAARDATMTALRADDQNAVFHALHGRVQLARRDYASALAANQRAVSLNPAYATAYCGVGDSLCYEGNYADAVTQFEHAVALGSHDPQLWAFLTYGALPLLFAGRYDKAIDWTVRAAAIPNCQYWTTAHRVVALAQSGQAHRASAEVPALLEQCPEFSIDYAEHKLFYLKRQDQRALYLQGLRSAGVPQGR